jgi:hypothetical protein
MPNWCNNRLTVSGPEADVTRFKEKAVGSSAWGKVEEREQSVLNFHSLAPVPAEVLAAGYNAAGYDWERANWGCKWGACHAELVDEWEGYLEYAFDTAWAPPIEFLVRLAPQWPSLTFVIGYEEMGVGFKGICKVQGDVVEDHCVNL